jgi:FAD/FMN-containing dehydrogenase
VEIAEASVGIERSEFDHACDRLAAAGYRIADRNEAWQRFAGLRSSYAASLGELARFFEIPPLQWIGDRSAIAISPHGDRSLHDGRSSQTLDQRGA